VRYFSAGNENLDNFSAIMQLNHIQALLRESFWFAERQDVPKCSTSTVKAVLRTTP